MPRATWQVLAESEWLFPPLPIQRRIATTLSAYDDLIENNTRRIQILEEIAQALYREWFVYFRFPGYEKVRMLESSLGKIPEGWEVKTFGEVSLNFDSKRRPLSSLQRAVMKGDYPYYGAAKVFDHVNDYIFDGDYLLVAEDGSVITEDRKPVLQMAYGKFWANNHTHIIQGKPPISTEVLYLALSDFDISGYVTGAAQPKITQANLNRIPIIVPTEPLLEQFNSLTRNLFAQVETLKRQNANLRRTRDLLLPRLVSGEVDVSGLDINTEGLAT
jgi:type I restriction enzyme S subunit